MIKKINEKNIADYLQLPESETLEFKSKVVDLSIIAKNVAAFANNMGGIIIFGFSEEFGICGCRPNTVKTIERAIESLKNPPKYLIYSVKYDNHELIILEISKNENVLTYANGALYFRKADTNQLMNMEQLEKRFSKVDINALVEAVNSMNNTINSLNEKILSYEAGLAKSDKKSLKYCIAGIVGGAIFTILSLVVSELFL